MNLSEETIQIDCLLCKKRPAQRIAGPGFKFIPCAQCVGSSDLKELEQLCPMCRQGKARLTGDGPLPCTRCMVKYSKGKVEKEKEIKSVSWDDPVAKVEELLLKHHSGQLDKKYYDKDGGLRPFK